MAADSKTDDVTVGFSKPFSDHDEDNDGMRNMTVFNSELKLLPQKIFHRKHGLNWKIAETGEHQLFFFHFPKMFQLHFWFEFFGINMWLISFSKTFF